MNETEIDWAAIPGSKWYSPEHVIPAFDIVRNAGEDSSNAMLFAVANNHGGELYPAAFFAVPILLEIATHDTNQRARASALAIIDDMLWFSPGLAPFDTVDVDGVSTPLDIAIRNLVAAALPALKQTEAEHPVSTLIGGLFESLTDLEA